MDTEKLQRLEVVAKNPEQVIESQQEISDRAQLRQLFRNSNASLTHRADDYEAGWKAAKAYYDVHS